MDTDMNATSTTPAAGTTAIICGPTASGKSELAAKFAKANGKIEIINADSLLVYRGFDLGTAKPTLDERHIIKHHLIDIRNPDEGFTAGDFLSAVKTSLDQIHERGNRAIIVGGTGFYLKALLYGLWDAPKTDPSIRAALEKKTNEELFHELTCKDPTSADRIGSQDRYRLIRALEIITISHKTPTELQSAISPISNPKFTLFVIDRETEELHKRIHSRTFAMLNAGLVDEVRSIRSKFPSSRPLSAVGYREVCAFLDGKAPNGRKLKTGTDGLADEIILATRQLVKRQRTWLRAEKNAKRFMLDHERQALESALAKIY